MLVVCRVRACSLHERLLRGTTGVTAGQTCETCHSVVIHAVREGVRRKERCCRRRCAYYIADGVFKTLRLQRVPKRVCASSPVLGRQSTSRPRIMSAAILPPPVGYRLRRASEERTRVISSPRQSDGQLPSLVSNLIGSRETCRDIFPASGQPGLRPISRLHSSFPEGWKSRYGKLLLHPRFSIANAIRRDPSTRSTEITPFREHVRAPNNAPRPSACGVR